ncbi:MAG TPA: ATP-binding protein [Candidatus Thermoplasmatota archaeon]|nr:ATP-binding protein [Candidatus Thermoplasmatota archaeon]
MRKQTVAPAPMQGRMHPAPAADEGVLTIGQLRLDLEREAAAERLRQRERQQAALARFARAALACQDVPALLDLAVREVRQTTAADLVGILEMSADGNTMTLRAGHGWGDGLVGHAQVPAGPGTLVRDMLERGPVLYGLGRGAVAIGQAPLLAEQGCVAGMSCPVPGRRAPFGILEAHGRGDRAFTQDDLDFLDAVAHTLASALERCAAEREVEVGRKRLEDLVAERTRQLALSNRELEAFNYSVSHDLREPLRAIHGFSTLLAQRVAGQPEAVDLLDRVRGSAVRLGNLIDALLDLSRVQRAELVRTPVDLSAMAAQILSDRARAEPERAVAWRVEPGLACEGDALLLRTMLLNLLGNAWKFTSKMPDPRIDVTRPGGGRAVCVRDNGAGFDMAYAAKLFRPFERLHTAAQFEGTGIGLATVQRIVERHGGRVWAEGRPGQGAAFYFTLEPERETAKP